jgi:hypothetical protein
MFDWLEQRVRRLEALLCLLTWTYSDITVLFS